MLIATANFTNDGGIKKNRKDDFVDFCRGKTLFSSNSKYYEAEVLLAIDKNGAYTFYDLLEVFPTTLTLKNDLTQNKRKNLSIATPKLFGDMPEVLTINSITENSEKVNTSDKSFLKYFPDQMLNEVQLLSKQIAILEDLKRAKLLQEKQGEKMKRPQNFNELLDIAKNRPDVHGALAQVGISLKRVGASKDGVRWQTETKGGTSGDLSAIAFIEKPDGKWIFYDNKGRFGKTAVDPISFLREGFGISFMP